MRAHCNFGRYAEYYDLIYHDKNYAEEVDFVEKCFLEFGKSKPKNLLEIGCGTGNYTQILIKRGYNVTGVDASENMLDVARRKVSCDLLRSDLRDLSLSIKFDACLAMFTVLGYLNKNSEIVKGLKTIRRHLKLNGLFVFDVWNGLALMRTLPECRFKEAENDELKVVRFAVPTLKAFEHVCEVNYKLFVHEKDAEKFIEIDERHSVRFYFPQELIYFLENAGFEVLKVCPFLDLTGTVDENTWTMAIIAKAV